jgi:YHS domain-containing protein
MLTRLIIILLLIYLTYSIIKYLSRLKFEKKISPNNFKSTPVFGEDLREDPVCHIYIPVSQAYAKEIAGKIHYFCSKECCEAYILTKSNER